LRALPAHEHERHQDVVALDHLQGCCRWAAVHRACGPAAGTGKSYLTDLVAAVITGRTCPTLSAADTQEELEKRLAGSVLSGQPIISIDNVNGDSAVRSYINC
jgi:hypothetical protein